MINLYEPSLTWRHKLAATRQLWSGWIGPGKTCEAFAALMCETVGRQHCTLTNSGTSALMLAYLALDLKPGSTVCCPAYGFPAAHNAARMLGLNVKLIDVDPATGAMNLREISSHIVRNGRCDCVVYVDHNGYVDPGLRDFKWLCEDRAKPIPLIEDSAVALGIPGAGITGDLAIYSFSVPKIVTSGQGGAVLTDNPALAKRLEQLVDQGGDWRQDRIHKAIGGNFRMADLNAALGLAQLRDLPRLIEKRNRLWGWYREVLPIHNDPGECKSGWMVTTECRDPMPAIHVAECLQCEGFHAQRLYCPVASNFSHADGQTYAGANEYHKATAYLPSSLNLVRWQVQRIGNIVRKHQ